MHCRQARHLFCRLCLQRLLHHPCCPRGPCYYSRRARDPSRSHRACPGEPRRSHCSLPLSQRHHSHRCSRSFWHWCTFRVHHWHHSFRGCCLYPHRHRRRYPRHLRSRRCFVSLLSPKYAERHDPTFTTQNGIGMPGYQNADSRLVSLTLLFLISHQLCDEQGEHVSCIPWLAAFSFPFLLKHLQVSN